MNALSTISNMFNGLLKKPGDSLSAFVTETGKQVIKINTGDTIRSAVRYPTGTIVETIVHRDKK